MPTLPPWVMTCTAALSMEYHRSRMRLLASRQRLTMSGQVLLRDAHVQGSHVDECAGAALVAQGQLATLPFCRSAYSGLPFLMSSMGTPNI